MFFLKYCLCSKLESEGFKKGLEVKLLHVSIDT